MMKLPGFLAVSLFLALALPRDAAAQTAEGPFYNRQHVVNYWVANPISSATEIYINGYLVHKAIGFGPFYRVQYFKCADGFIRTSCNTVQGPFEYSGALYDYVLAAPNGANTRTYVDTVLFMAGASPLFGVYHYTTCSGDVSPFGYDVVTYLVMSSGTTIYGSIPGLACLPPV